MPRDMNPNRIPRKEVDEVFIATASEIMYRKSKARKDRPQLRQANLKKAEQIVEKAKQKGKQ